MQTLRADSHDQVIALFRSRGIKVHSHAIYNQPDRLACEQLLDHVEVYFASAAPPAADCKIIATSRPPIYFQQPGHSMTIVGLERHYDGSRNLLILDPAFEPTIALTGTIKGSLGQDVVEVEVASAMKRYRRTYAQLAKYAIFEVVIFPEGHDECSEPQKNTIVGDLLTLAGLSLVDEVEHP